MHYYKFNIADWNLATSHLSLEEEAVYFKLINYYYDTESPIPEETQSVIRRLRLGSQIKTVELILNEFFEFIDGFWHHLRCDEEIAEYQKKAEKNKINGNRGGRPKKINELSNNPEITQMVTEKNPEITLTTNHKPLTINHNNKGDKSPNRFIKPVLDDVVEYGKEKELNIDAQKFIDYYDSNGWMVGRNKMKDWKAAVRNWASRNFDAPQTQTKQPAITEAEINKAARPGESRDQVYRRLMASRDK